MPSLSDSFTMLPQSELEAGIRCNLVVALGDLAFRFPNSLEPWTAHMYQPLGDPDLGEREALSHPRRSLFVIFTKGRPVA